MNARWLALAFGLISSAAAAQTAAKPPIVVELFTSQGCSSCPPADAIVAELARTRPDLLALTFHVTYWDNLGWRDPFSLAGATERQRRYVAGSVTPELYTPAMVIDGQQDVIGSDRRAVEAGLARAAASAQAAVPVRISRDGQALAISIGAGAGRGSVLVFGYDRQHQTPVGRGENGGRTLVEANVVRSIGSAGIWNGDSLRLSTAVPEGEQVAVIVQADDGRILGVGRLNAS